MAEPDEHLARIAEHGYTILENAIEPSLVADTVERVPRKRPIGVRTALRMTGLLIG